MITVAQNTNLAIRFAVEMALLAILGAWAWHTVPSGALRIAAAVGLPLAVATVWATVVHGQDVPSTIRLATQVVLFAAAAVALWRLTTPAIAASFVSVTALNAALMTAWAQ